MEIQTYISSSTLGVNQCKSIRFGQGVTTETPHKLVHEIFNKTAAENPSAVAVEHDGDQITYGELDLASTNLSRKLISLGLCPRDRVVLLVQRSLPMMVAIFAVLKSGCQYVALDGGVASDDALAHVLSETEPPFVLCLTRYLQRAHQFAMLATQILSLEDSWTTSTDSDIEAGHKPFSGGVTPLTLSTSSSSLVPGSQSSEEDISEKSRAGASITITTLPLPGSQEYLAEREFVLPPEKGARSHLWLRYYFFTMYRRLFSVVFIGNLATILIIFIYRRTLDKLQLSDLATATASNITVTLLMRQEYVINCLFNVACSVPTWMPLLIRRNCAKVFHIGGIHSSAGVAAVFWFAILTVAATVGLAAPERTSLGKTNLAIVLIVYMILALCVSILITAYPSVRAKRHDVFERTHRFAGWTILVLFWILTVLSADAARGYVPLSKALTRDPTLYLLIVSTVSVILPWLRLRKVPVRSEVLSSHAVRLHFSYTNTYPGTTIRISERPLMEWHAFATVAKPGVHGFSLIVSNAGDWTKRQIGHTPERLWVRGIPACGVLRITPLFKRIVLMATGSGIGPCLPVLLAKKVPMRVFWSTPNPEQTFGEEIIASVKGADANAVIWNTREKGRPDMVKEGWKLVVESGMTSDGGYEVEAVCIIANKKVTEMVVRGMEVRGMAAYGAIFDS